MSVVANENDISTPRAFVVAKGLSKPQRYHVERGCISGDFTISTVHALAHKGVFRLRISSPNGRAGHMVLTEFGEKVRAALVALADVQPNTHSLAAEVHKP